MTDMNKDIRRSAYSLFTAMLLLCSCSSTARSGRAAGDEITMDINITGTVVATGSCTFSAGSGSTVGVDFGSIRYSSNGGFLLEGEYRKALNSTMNCTGDTFGTAIMTFASGSSKTVNFDGNKLLPVTLNGNTSKNLGIELLVNGVVQNVGAAFNVDMSAPPTLEAELVQIGSSDIVSDGAELTSSATLTMAFQ